MAKEEKKEEKKEESGASEGKKSKKLLIIIIVAILVLIIVAGVAIAMLLMGEDENAKNAQTAQNTQQSAPQAQEKSVSSRSRDGATDNIDSRKLSQIGILYPLDTFTVNLKSDSGRRYLKATISLELNGQELSIELDNKAPVIRDRIIRILTSKTLEEISSQKGKQKVTEQIMDTLNSIISDGSIQGIYFTEFVIQ
ncbi:MAG: flagellar protein FliL [Campylobacterota bacterium]|nr:flagellar protein FliL [Campylobacterota bacterium]